MTVASPKIAFGRALFLAGEEATNQVGAEAYVTTTSNCRVEAAKERIVDQPSRDSLDDQRGAPRRADFDATTVLRFGVHQAAILQPDSRTRRALRIRQRKVLETVGDDRTHVDHLVVVRIRVCLQRTQTDLDAGRRRFPRDLEARVRSKRRSDRDQNADE